MTSRITHLLKDFSTVEEASEASFNYLSESETARKAVEEVVNYWLDEPSSQDDIKNSGVKTMEEYQVLTQERKTRYREPILKLLNHPDPWVPIHLLFYPGNRFLPTGFYLEAQKHLPSHLVLRGRAWNEFFLRGVEYCDRNHEAMLGLFNPSQRTPGLLVRAVDPRLGWHEPDLSVLFKFAEDLLKPFVTTKPEKVLVAVSHLRRSLHAPTAPKLDEFYNQACEGLKMRLGVDYLPVSWLEEVSVNI
jgi:hypothetical protein